MTAGYSRHFDRALVLAALVHENVPRKGTAIPYIIHPVQVATILLRHGYPVAGVDVES
jgi:(p)ppGpp synthase/HD superfamily hydrolase